MKVLLSGDSKQAMALTPKLPGIKRPLNRFPRRPFPRPYPCTCHCRRNYPCRHNGACHAVINCMGFDRMTDEEIMFVADNSPNPELMGSKVGQFFKKVKGKAKKFVKKVATKYKKLPKWAKVATGILGAPLALAAAPAALSVALPAAVAAAPVATKVAVGFGIKKGVQKVKKMTPAQRKRLAMAAGAVLLPGTATAIATTAAAAKAAKATGKLAARGVSAVQAVRAKRALAAQAAVPSVVEQVQVPSADEAAAVEAAQANEAAQPKKGGLGTLLGLGALAALPFLLGS